MFRCFAICTLKSLRSVSIQRAMVSRIENVRKTADDSPLSLLMIRAEGENRFGFVHRSFVRSFSRWFRFR